MNEMNEWLDEMYGWKDGWMNAWNAWNGLIYMNGWMKINEIIEMHEVIEMNEMKWM